MIPSCSENSEHQRWSQFRLSFPDSIVFLKALLFQLYFISLATTKRLK